MRLTITQKKSLAKLAEKYDLKFIILYGSHVRGQNKPDSDLDMAVLQNSKSKKKLEYLAIYQPLHKLFPSYELDLSFLNKADALFLHEVTSNSQLLYGVPETYAAFKSYAFRRYIDEKDLFNLQDILLKKQQHLLQKKLYA